jgi:hypothetical protein
MSMQSAQTIVGAPCVRGHTERYRSGACAACRRESERRRYAADPQAFATKRRRAYLKQAEYYRNFTKKWRAENRDLVLEQKRRWYYRNKEKILAGMRVNGHKKRGMPEPTRPRPENCEICGKLEKRGVLHLDHCHETNKFRGWLCSPCNLGLGKLGDSVASLRAALTYLERAE